MAQQVGRVRGSELGTSSGGTLMRRSIAVFLFALACFASGPATAVALTATFPPLIRQINSPEGVPSFGFSFNNFNGNLLVGANGSSNDTVYVIDLNTGAQLLKVNSPDAGNGSVS